MGDQSDWCADRCIDLTCSGGVILVSLYVAQRRLRLYAVYCGATHTLALKWLLIYTIRCLIVALVSANMRQTWRGQLYKPELISEGKTQLTTTQSQRHNRRGASRDGVCASHAQWGANSLTEVNTSVLTIRV